MQSSVPLLGCERPKDGAVDRGREPVPDQAGYGPHIAAFLGLPAASLSWWRVKWQANPKINY
jgi:hypothetical protein